MVTSPATQWRGFYGDFGRIQADSCGAMRLHIGTSAKNAHPQAAFDVDEAGQSRGAPNTEKRLIYRYLVSETLL